MSENIFDSAQSIEEVLGLAVGAGSTCWEHMAGTGIFLSNEASEVVTEASKRIHVLLLEGKERMETMAVQCECEAQTRGGFHQEPCIIPNVGKLPHPGVESLNG